MQFFLLFSFRSRCSYFCSQFTSCQNARAVAKFSAKCRLTHASNKNLLQLFVESIKWAVYEERIRQMLRLFADLMITFVYFVLVFFLLLVWIYIFLFEYRA